MNLLMCQAYDLNLFAILMTMINARLCRAIEEVDSVAIIQINRTQ